MPRRLISITSVCLLLLTLAPASSPGQYDLNSSEPAPTIARPGFSVKVPPLPSTVAEQGNVPYSLPNSNTFEQNGHTPIPLSPRNQSDNSLLPPRSRKSGNVVSTVVSSLAIVIGLIFALAWFSRRAMPKANTMLPGEVVETLGRTPLGNRQQMHLVRVGNKLILLSVTPNGAETLTEITEAQEVQRLLQLCKSKHSDSINTSFQNVLSELGEEPTTPGFLGDSSQDQLEVANRSSAASGTGAYRA